MVTAAGAPGAVSQLTGRRAIVTTAGMPLGRKLVQGLKRHGARVVEIQAVFTSKAQADTALGDAAGELGGVDLVVHGAANGQALAAKSLTALSAADWHAAVHGSFLATLFCLQAAHSR